MRATGIVRRIDDLGRVAIPKGIRQQLGIQEGDPLELYVNENSIIFKPHYVGVSEEFSSLVSAIEYQGFIDINDQQKILEILRNARKSIMAIENKTSTAEDSDI